MRGSRIRLAAIGIGLLLLVAVGWYLLAGGGTAGQSVPAITAPPVEAPAEDPAAVMAARPITTFSYKDRAPSAGDGVLHGRIVDPQGAPLNRVTVKTLEPVLDRKAWDLSINTQGDLSYVSATGPTGLFSVRLPPSQDHDCHLAARRQDGVWFLVAFVRDSSEEFILTLPAKDKLSRNEALPSAVALHAAFACCRLSPPEPVRPESPGRAAVFQHANPLQGAPPK